MLLEMLSMAVQKSLCDTITYKTYWVTNQTQWQGNHLGRWSLQFSGYQTGRHSCLLHPAVGTRFCRKESNTVYYTPHWGLTHNIIPGKYSLWLHLYFHAEVTTSHACCVWTCSKIEGSYDKIIITIVPSYTEKNTTRLLPLALLLVLRTRNNTDGNKLVIFSSIASYYGDNYMNYIVIYALENYHLN